MASSTTSTSRSTDEREQPPRRSLPPPPLAVERNVDLTSVMELVLAHIHASAQVLYNILR